MTRNRILLVLLLLIGGCASLPSFYDDNESKGIVDLYVSVKRLDCNEHNGGQVRAITHNIEWSRTYSATKGSDDIGMLLAKMDETIQPLVKRERWSFAYCSIKKKLILKQVKVIAETIMGRY